MSLTAQRLYELLPVVHRLRDEAQGGPLKALLGAFAAEFAALEDNLEQLYDDQFIETCADWVAPYIGDLIGYRPLHGVAPKIASPRAEVANTIALRRRKGTALVLEQLAHDVTDWPARAVEFFEQLATTQHMKHRRLHAPATTDFRNLGALLQRDGAFNALAHTAELRRPESGAGRYNVPNVGLFLWRLLALPLTQLPLTPDPADASGRRFRVNPLGADLPLFRKALTEDDIEHLAEPANVPEPLTVRKLALALASDYGVGRSLVLWRTPAQPLPIAQVRVCDLRDLLDAGGNVIGWNHEDDVAAGTVGIDPERGRVLLGAPADGPLLASLHHGSIRRIGGGEYERTPSTGDDGGAPLHAANGEALQASLDAIAGGGTLVVDDSRTYAETPVFTVDGETAAGVPGHRVVVSARNPARPLLQAAGEVRLDIGARGTLVLEGWVIAGGALRVPGSADNEPRTLILRDCTLVPGRTLNGDGSAVSPGALSLVVEHPAAKVVLERCITGPLRAVADAELQLSDCIVDAGAPENVAFDGSATGGPGAELSTRDCTVIGKVHTRLARLVENTILFARLGPAPGETWTAPVRVQRRQQGCLRFSFVPDGSVTPQRHRCVPDAAHPDVLPHFTSLRYGDPGYAQLRSATDAAIRRGASDESEIGVLRPLNQPQRESNLLTRLDEYLRFGLHAGLFYAT